MDQDEQPATTAAAPAPAAEGARAVPVQGSSGGFKLKLKFGGAPVIPSSQRPKEDEEDQLADGSSSDEESGSSEDDELDVDDVDGSSVVSGSTSIARPYPHDGSDGGSRLSSVGPSDEEASVMANNHLQVPHQPDAPASDDTRSAGDGASEAGTSVAAPPTEPAFAAPPPPPPATKKRKRPSAASKAKGANGLLAPPKAKAPATKKRRFVSAPSQPIDLALIKE